MQVLFRRKWCYVILTHVMCPLLAVRSPMGHLSSRRALYEALLRVLHHKCCMASSSLGKLCLWESGKGNRWWAHHFCFLYLSTVHLWVEMKYACGSVRTRISYTGVNRTRREAKGGHEGEKRVTNIFPVLKRFNPPFCKIVFRIWPKMKSVLSSGKFLPTFLSFTLKTCVLGLATWLYTSLAHSKV